jgi:hypothetical protein
MSVGAKKSENTRFLMMRRGKGADFLGFSFVIYWTFGYFLLDFWPVFISLLAMFLGGMRAINQYWDSTADTKIRPKTLKWRQI